MSDYVAIVQITATPPTPPCHATRCWPTEGVGPGVSITEAVQACETTLAGVREAAFDSQTGALTIVFDRSRVNVADIVRFLEDRGLTVVAVAQGRADVEPEIASRS